jgi:hypothetical protein
MIGDRRKGKKTIDCFIGAIGLLSSRLFFLSPRNLHHLRSLSPASGATFSSSILCAGGQQRESKSLRCNSETSQREIVDRLRREYPIGSRAMRH